MNDQAQQLRRQMNKGTQQAKTIAVISGKGGVGKSNITLNVAIDLVNRGKKVLICLLYTSPSPRDRTRSRMPSSA